jgi:hypothetical protein
LKKVIDLDVLVLTQRMSRIRQEHSADPTVEELFPCAGRKDGKCSREKTGQGDNP